MTVSTPEASDLAAVDRALAEWRQGDCVLGEHWFLHRFDPALPLTAEARGAAAEGMEAVATPVRGLVVVTQTCDIVRSCIDRPFIEVSPLVEFEESKLAEVYKRARPQYAYIEPLKDQRLVADLDRTMTIEKALLAGWPRIAGWTTDAEARNFSRSLERKRNRVAFPDDFTALTQKLQARIKDKHGKNSVEGRALRELVEIRVQASPSWSFHDIKLFFWFIRPEELPEFEGRAWVDLVQIWMGLIPGPCRLQDIEFTQIEWLVTTHEPMTAAEYRNSSPLDLDYLSISDSRGE